MGSKIITISRQFGSGGRTIGKLVAEKLGIPCYDEQLIEKVAEDSGFAQNYVAEHGEYAAYGNWLGNALMSGHSTGGINNQDRLWISQRRVILDLADKPCVIVGRCAEYILQETDATLLRVFIRADMDARAERIVKLYGESDVAPVKRLKDKDKRRAAYFRYYTDMEWGDIENYDIVLNSAAVGINSCVDILVKLYSQLS